MTLGETILTLRKRQKLSQEDVGAILDVSRQAVSKWETDQSLPDTGNLLALAKLFGVTVEELTGARPPAAEEVPSPDAPPAPRRPRKRLWWVICALAFLALPALFLLMWNDPSDPPLPGENMSSAAHTGTAPSDSIPSTALPGTADLPDTSFFWFDRGIQKHLSLDQTGLWDFGQHISTYSVDGPRDTDWHNTTVTNYLCSAPETSPTSFDTFSVTVLSVTDEETQHDTITALATTSEALSTPRGIHVGSPEGDVLQAYDDGNLSPEEVYRYRRQLFSNLSGLDWQAYGRIACDVGAESPDYGAAVAEAQEALMAWLRSQNALSYDELRWLQAGVQSHPDGFLAEEYSAILCHAFFLYPIDFTKALAEFDGPEADFGTLLSFTAYGAACDPRQRDDAAEQVRSALSQKLLPEQPAQALLDALAAPC